MTEEYQKAIVLYISVMAIFIEAYKNGKISKKNYKTFEKNAEKNRPQSC